MLYPVAKPEGLPENETDGEERLAAVQSLAAAGGARNCGAYCFQILPDTPEASRGFGGIVAFVDAEDPDRSSCWCRECSDPTARARPS